MRPDLDGGGVKPVLVTPGVGYKGKRYVNKNSKIYRYKYEGIRRRRNLRGNVISQSTRQINLKVVDYGKRPLGVIFGLEDEASAGSSEEE
jgi:ribosomal protein S6E (S10)